ncbi:MAG: replication protein P, partial [Gammaproteobacteria bacterium]|nr:replication protein P [Gammaproteobacteria bacterium]
PMLGGASIMDHLFSRLDSLYPIRWRSAFPNKRAIAQWRETWAEGFAEEGLGLEDIKKGIKACYTRFPWPPSFAEFVSACRPSMDFESAFYEAVEQMRLRESGHDQWSHPAMYWAAASIGAFDLRNATWGGIKDRWIATLQAELEKRAWPEVPSPKRSLPPLGKTTITREESRQRIMEIKKLLKKPQGAIPCLDSA